MFYLTLIFGTLPKLTRTLSRGSVSWGALYLKMLAFLVARKVTESTNPWHFTLFYGEKRFALNLYEGSVDIAALKEIFLDKEYEWLSPIDPRVIIDCGAHTGNTSIYFHLMYPHATIYAIEASPKNFEKLQDNVRAISNIVPIFCAVGATDGMVSFYESESSLGSSIHSRGHATSKIEVPAMTLRTLFTSLGIHSADFMKIDIEGSENMLFREQSPSTFSPRYIIEVHEDIMGETGYAETYFRDFKNRIRPLSMKGRYLLYAEQ